MSSTFLRICKNISEKLKKSWFFTAINFTWKKNLILILQTGKLWTVEFVKVQRIGTVLLECKNLN